MFHIFKKKPFHYDLTDAQRNVILNVLMEKRNELIRTGHYTDAIDEVLLTLCK